MLSAGTAVTRSTRLPHTTPFAPESWDTCPGRPSPLPSPAPLGPPPLPLLTKAELRGLSSPCKVTEQHEELAQGPPPWAPPIPHLRCLGSSAAC